MEDLILAVNKAIDELEEHSDGLPDYLVHSIAKDLRNAVEDSERAMDRWREEQDELHHRYPHLYPKILERFK